MVGQTVGKYRIVDRLGRGGMGMVYRAVDETLQREVAIKVLHAELNDPDIARRFRAEAVTVARLSHPAIAGIYELFEHDGEWLMIMEFVRGETLEKVVNRMGPLSAPRAAELCMQTLTALAHAHSMGVVHRDLKPANLMITENGGVKVMDFGIARVAGAEQLTNAGYMVGTPAYMAPEQVRGGDIDARADLYALGVVFYRLTTGALPFKGDTAFAMAQSQVLDPPTPVGLVRPDLPPWVGEIVGRALAKAPEHRFQSAAEFHEAFARCLAGLPLSSMYGPGDPLMTPGRPIPTGAFQMRPMPTPMPLPSGQFYQPAAMPAGEEATVPLLRTPPHLISGANDPTMMATPVGIASIPAAAGLTSAPAASSTTAAPSAPARAKRRLVIALIAGAGIIVVAGGIGAVMMLQGGQPSELPVPPPPSVSAAELPGPAGLDALPSPAVSPPIPSTTPTPPARPQTLAPGTSSPVDPARGASRVGTPPANPVADDTAPAGAAVAPPPTPPADTGGAATPVASDPLLTFPDVKLYTVTNGRNTNDRDALLSFAGGQLLVMLKSGGAAVATLPYGTITRATYVKARDPKWDPALPGPPEGVDVGSFLRQGRHWLVLQGPDHYEILRLEDNNFTRILSTIEERTGVKVDRPKSD